MHGLYIVELQRTVGVHYSYNLWMHVRFTSADTLLSVGRLTKGLRIWHVLQVNVLQARDLKAGQRSWHPGCLKQSNGEHTIVETSSQP